MSEARRNLFVNLTGALVVGLWVGYVMSVGIGGPPFRELFVPNFLRAFVPYVLAALLAWKFAPRIFGHVVADYVFSPLVGSGLSLALFYYSNAGFAPPPVEFAPVLAVVFAGYFSNYVGLGVLALLAVRGVRLLFDRLSLR